MKKVSLLIAAFALVLGFSQCRKPNLPALNGETQHVVLNASWDNGGSKIEQNGSLLKWTEGDKLTVSGGATGTLSCTDAANGTFEGEITKGSGEDITFTFKSEKYKEDLMEQTGALADAVSLKSAELEYKANGNYGTVSMEMTHAVLKLNLSYFAPSPSKADVTVEISVKAEDKKPISPIASVKCASDRLGEVYVTVPANGSAATYTFSGSGKTVEMSWPALYGNTFFTAGGNGGAAVIKPTPKFTVADGKTVEFSKGNLQYLGQAEEGHKWRFAEHQWDIMGAGPSATSNKGNVDLGADYEGKYNTGSGSEAARDLFGWGCTGYEDTRKESHTDWYQKNYQPYSTSKSTVNATYNYYGYGPDYNGNKYGLSVKDKSDWGSLAIGSDPAGTWRTLSSAEWAYLFNTRTVNGGKGEGKSYRRATINSDASDGSKVYGILLYPDGYTAQTTATSYTKAEWSAMESAGVVFLPAPGYRDGTSLGYVGSFCFYWSSSCNNSSRAYYVNFSSSYVNPQDVINRYYGISVRLVR